MEADVAMVNKENNDGSSPVKTPDEEKVVNECRVCRMSYPESNVTTIRRHEVIFSKHEYDIRSRLFQAKPYLLRLWSLVFSELSKRCLSLSAMSAA